MEKCYYEAYFCCRLLARLAVVPSTRASYHRSLCRGPREGASALFLWRKDGMYGTCQGDSLTLEYQPSLWVVPLEVHFPPSSG